MANLTALMVKLSRAKGQTTKETSNNESAIRRFHHVE